MNEILKHLDAKYTVRNEEIYLKTGTGSKTAQNSGAVAYEIHKLGTFGKIGVIEPVVEEWLANQVTAAATPETQDLSPKTFTDSDKGLLGGVRWAVSEDGIPVLFGLVDNKTNTYKPVTTIDAYLRGTYTPTGVSYYTIAHARYVAILSNCNSSTYPPLAALWQKCRRTITNGRAVISMPSIQFMEYLELSSEFMLSDPTLQIKFPTTISNDVATPNCHYVDLSVLPTGDISAWEEWETQLPTQAHIDIWRAWVYSIVEEKCRDHHIMWLHGGGGNAKSTMAEALHLLVGGGKMVGVLHPNVFEPHQNIQLVGKRLGIDADVKNINILSKGEVHKVCSGDLTVVNPKGESPFSIAMYMRMLYIANVPPMIDMSKDSERRRLIYIKMQPYPDHIAKKVYYTDENGNFIRDSSGRLKQKGNSDFGEALKAQVWNYLAKCKDSYYMLKPDKSTQIMVPDEVSEDMYTHIHDDDGMKFEALIADDFILGKDLYTEAIRMNVFLKETKKFNNFQHNALTAWLEKTHNVVKKRKAIPNSGDDTRVNMYVGIAIKNATSTKDNPPTGKATPSTLPFSSDNLFGAPF